MKKKKKSVNKIIVITAIIYIIVLARVILFKYVSPVQCFRILMTGEQINRSGHINLIPFYYGPGKLFSTFDVVGNIVAFIPFGVYTGVFFKRFSWIKTVVLGFMLSFFVEFTQYYLGIGAPDITDIITNTTGALVGVVFYSLLKLIFREKGANVIVAIFGTVLAGLGIYLITLLLPAYMTY